MDMSKLALACLLWGHELTVLLGILEGAELDHRLNRSAVLTIGSTQDGGLLEYRYAQDDTKRLNVSEILLSAFVPFHDRVSSDTYKLFRFLSHVRNEIYFSDPDLF